MLISLIISLLFLIIAIAVHEFAHAFTADKLGDPTARANGRLTLNPLAHIDPLGTVAMPLTLMLISGGSFAFGYGKPTPYDPYNLQKPNRDVALISLAGPLSNFLLALIVAVAAHFLPHEYSFLATSFIIINLSLAIFNLIPVGPLDGQKILFSLLPIVLAVEYQRIMDRYGTLILILLILPFNGVSPLSALISPAVIFLTNLLLF